MTNTAATALTGIILTAKCQRRMVTVPVTVELADSTITLNVFSAGGNGIIGFTADRLTVNVPFTDIVTATVNV